MSGEPKSWIGLPEAGMPFRRESRPTLAAAWERSLRTLAELGRRLADVVDLPGLETVAIAGSLARCEQTAASDADLIVVTSNDDGDDETALRVGRSVWDRLQTGAFPQPKPDGIFARPISSAVLCDPATLGVVDENMPAFGLRMQLLLEGRPVCRDPGRMRRGPPIQGRDDRFAALLRRILLRFLPDGKGGNNPWRPLLDDLLRYHRSLCARYRTARHAEPERRRELRLKAGFGRLANVVGLLVLLGDSLAEPDPLDAVLRGCPGTPLQRIAASYHRHGDAGFDRVCELYEPFVAAFEDAAFRRGLNGLPEHDAATQATLARLDIAACELKRELCRFLFERIQRGDWPRSFCDDLLL
jgi:predicted nucleotidyltransferase